MEGLLVIVFIGIGIAIYFIQAEGHESSIESYVESLGGRLIGYERRSFFSGIGPFTIVGKGRVVYCVRYERDGQQEEGFVRFGGLGGPDWRF